MKLHTFGLGLILTATSLLAQNATLSGILLDSSGAAVTGATVTALNLDTGVRRITSSNDTGFYSMPSMQPGRYKTTAQHPGFVTIVRDRITLDVAQNARLDFTLQVSAKSETVTVQADVSLINTADASVSTVVTHEQVANMPLNGRSLQSLITLTPGVVLANATDQSPGQFSADGQRTYTNYFTVDGVSANFGIGVVAANTSASGAQPALTAVGGTQSLVSLDALQEFRIQTSSYAPEFGRSPGAQIELLTRSGGNSIHGSLFEYVRNDIFDANDWFAGSLGLPKPELRQNDFGGTFGGPVRFPAYSGRNRTFFFVSYEGVRVRQPQFLITQVPAQSTRQSAVPAVQPLLNAFPIPTGKDLIDPSTGQPTGFAEFSDSHSDPSIVNATGLRVDHLVNDRISLFSRYSYTPSNFSTRHLSNVFLESGSTQTLTGAVAMRISPTIFNDFRLNFSRSVGNGISTLDRFGGAVVPPDSILFSGGQSVKIGNMTFLFPARKGSFSVGVDALNRQRQTNLVDSLALVRGKHSLKFGIDYRRLFPFLGPAPYSGNIIFRDLSQMLAGDMSFGIISSRLTAVEPVFVNWSVFVQDRWQPTSRLSVTYGLRWEVNPVPHNSNGPDPAVLTGLDNPATFALARRGTPLYPTRYANFAPRLGIAYEISKLRGWELVLRAGGGSFYDLGSSQATQGFVDFPLSASNVFVGVPFPLTPAEAAPPTVSLSPPYNGSFDVYGSRFNLPFTEQWNTALEQALGNEQSLTVSYVGNHGRRNLRLDTFASPNPNFPNFVNVYRSDATSDYNALQVQFQRRMSRGFQVLASYTWAHAIDELSDDVGPTQENETSRANSSFDIRHSLAASVSYELPGLQAGRLSGAIVNGWGVDAIIHAQTAAPVDLIDNFSVFGASQVTIRPDVVPGQPFYLHDSTVPGGTRYNNNAFTSPPIDPNTFAPLRQGTLGRNVLRGLPLSQLDFAIRRNLNLTEHCHLQFRAEAFNILNHPNFGSIDNFVGDPNLGVPRSMLGRSLGGLSPIYQIGGPRSLQFSLRIAF